MRGPVGIYCSSLGKRLCGQSRLRGGSCFQYNFEIDLTRVTDETGLRVKENMYLTAVGEKGETFIILSILLKN